MCQLLVKDICLNKAFHGKLGKIRTHVKINTVSNIVYYIINTRIAVLKKAELCKFTSNQVHVQKY